jgi:MarR family transcriptional regulator, lower aerobic nicotinate degradation pathway regulator
MDYGQRMPSKTREHPNEPSDLGLLLAQAGRAVTRRFQDALSPMGVRPRPMSLLFILREAPMSQQQLAAVIDIAPTNLVGLLNDLEKHRLVRRVRDPADRRRHVVEITQRGLKRADEVAVKGRAVEDEFFSALTAEERQQLKQMLQRVVAAEDLIGPAELIDGRDD